MGDEDGKGNAESEGNGSAGDEANWVVNGAGSMGRIDNAADGLDDGSNEARFGTTVA